VRSGRLKDGGLMKNFYGLTGIPKIEGVSSKRYKPFKKHKGDGLGAFSAANQKVMEETINSIKNPKLILEIGVCNNKEHYYRTSTATILKSKPADCTYVGVDIVDKTSILKSKFPNEFDKTAHFFKADSKNISKVMNFINSLGFNEIDLLHIDGLHTIEHIPYDWRYSEYVSKKGKILLHDTNQHPGPVALLDFIDDKIFQFKKKCTSDNDNGITLLWRK